MDKLRGVESLDVVYRRFSDGVEVVRCVLEFCKAVGDVESSYSNSMQKILKSSSYTLHSNILMQWLGSEPYREIGTLRNCWQKLGSEFGKLADLHSEKAGAYLDTVRKPLLELLPQLEETRKELKIKIQMLRANLDIAYKKHNRERQKYNQMGEAYLKLKEKVNDRTESQASVLAKANLNRMENKLASQRRDLEHQENIYKETHSNLTQAQESFNAEVAELYKTIQDKELERVKTVKMSLQEFAKVLSNTAPPYLESMKRILISIEEIDGSSDIEHFVNDHQDLLVMPEMVVFEMHLSREEESPQIARAYTEVTPSPQHTATFERNDSLYNGDRTRSPSSLGEDEQVSSTSRQEKEMREDRSRDDENVSDSTTVASSESTGSEKLLKENLSPVTKRKRPHFQNVASKPVFPDKPVQAEQPKRQAQDRATVPPPVRKKPVKPPTAQGHTSSLSNERSSVKGASNFVSSGSSTSTVTSSTSFTNSTTTGVSSTSSSSSSKSVGGIQPRFTSKSPMPYNEAKPPAPVKTSKTSELEHPSLTQTRTLPLPSSSMPPVTSSVRLSGSVKAKPAHVTAGDPEELRLLSKLQNKAAGSDYYALFGVQSNASLDDISKARREKSREFHPDHYGNDPERQAKAQESLTLINRVFQNVMKTKEKRDVYDKICHFRPMYPRILQQPLKGLEAAQGKLTTLHKQVKKGQLPLEIQEELEMALDLIKTRIQNLSKER